MNLTTSNNSLPIIVVGFWVFSSILHAQSSNPVHTGTPENSNQISIVEKKLNDVRKKANEDYRIVSEREQLIERNKRKLKRAEEILQIARSESNFEVVSAAQRKIGEIQKEIDQDQNAKKFAEGRLRLNEPQIQIYEDEVSRLQNRIGPAPSGREGAAAPRDTASVPPTYQSTHTMQAQKKIFVPKPNGKPHEGTWEIVTEVTTYDLYSDGSKKNLRTRVLGQ